MRRCALLTMLVVCAATTGETSELQSGIDALLKTVPKGGQVGIMVIELAAGKILYSHDETVSLHLASTTKLLVASAALCDLGSTYQFHTRVVGLGPLADGTVPGLGVIGGGSPCLDEHFFAKDPNLVFKSWADELKRRGVARIAGDLVIDASLFSGPIRPATYPADAENQQRWYSAPASAFAWNDNCISVRVVPGKLGEAADVQVWPRSPRIAVRNQTTTVARGDDELHVNRDAQGNGLTVTGTYARTTAWFPLAIHSDPDLLIGDHLKAVLADAGIAVSGECRLGKIDPDAGPLFIDLKQDLVPAVTLMNQHSQNFYGEQLLRLLGVKRFSEGSLAAGGRALTAILGEQFGDLTGVTVVDGSGLSYDNSASAGFMARMLLTMHRSVHGDEFVNSLKDHWSGKIRGRVKTGSLAVASCYAGFMDRPAEGGRVAFVILINKGAATGFDWGPALREKLFKAIAAGIAEP